MTTNLLEPPQKHEHDVENEAKASEQPLSTRALKRFQEREKLRTSKFDVVSASLMSLAWFIGTFVLMLLLIWLTTKFYPGSQRLGGGPVIEPGRENRAEGIDRDFDPPSDDEVVELSEPTTQETLIAVTDAVSSVAAVQNTGTSKSSGDNRPPGPGSDDIDIVSPHERWELRFSAKNVAEYADQLDFFNIELGVLGGGVQGVDYAKRFVGSPKVRAGESESEKRLYFMWVDRSSPLFQFDRQLLQKLGINIGAGRELLKFIEPELADMLVSVELEFAEKKGHASVTEIQKTIFESRPVASGYAFEVLDQRYRKPRKR